MASDPFLNAAKTGDLHAIQELCTPSHFTKLDFKGRNALMIAGKNGHLEIVKFFVQLDVNIYFTDKKGRNVFMLAAMANQTDVVEYFLKKSIDVTCRNNEGKNALMLAAQEGCEKVVECLVSANIVNDITSVDNNRRDALMLAAVNDQVHVVDCLMSHGANLSCKDKSRQNALMVAAKKGRKRVVEFLLGKNADIIQRDHRDRTALMLASMEGQTDVVEVLLPKHSYHDMELADNEGKTALILAACKGHVSIVKILCDRGCNVNHQADFVNTALHFAAEKNHLDVAKTLLKANAALDIHNVDGEDPLGLAYNNKHAEMFRLLGGNSIKADEEEQQRKPKPKCKGDSKATTTTAGSLTSESFWLSSSVLKNFEIPTANTGGQPIRENPKFEKGPGKDKMMKRPPSLHSFEKKQQTTPKETRAAMTLEEGSPVPTDSLPAREITATFTSPTVIGPLHYLQSPIGQLIPAPLVPIREARDVAMQDVSSTPVQVRAVQELHIHCQNYAGGNMVLNYAQQQLLSGGQSSAGTEDSALTDGSESLGQESTRD